MNQNKIKNFLIYFILDEFSLFFNLALNYLKSEFKSSLNSSIQQTNALLISLMVIFILILVFSFLMVYLPWVKMLRDEVIIQKLNDFLKILIVFKNIGINRNHA